MRNSVQQGEWEIAQGLLKLRDLVNQSREILNQREFIKKRGATTNATPLSIWSEAMPVPAVWNVEYLIQGLDSTNNYARYHESSDIRIVSGGVTTLLATTVIEAAFEDVPAWGFTLNVGNASVGLSVTGAAATSIKWVAYIVVNEVK